MNMEVMNKSKNGVKAYTREGEPIVTFYSIKREKDKLVADAEVLDSMRMDIVFTLKEFFSILKLVFSWGVISYVLLVPFFALKNLFTRKTSSGSRDET